MASIPFTIAWPVAVFLVVALAKIAQSRFIEHGRQHKTRHQHGRGPRNGG